ncbi:MAG: PTS sugar transporter subunit IIA [Erysipelotrichaceae bacterium]|nr:PTS sugar transporter subunit IIA [Erysipelotrichaceae bacterium]
MLGFIVSGHGRFASGITAALELIMGEQENYIAVDFPEGDGKTQIEANMAKAIAQLEGCEGIVVFCDLLSGSPFNTAVMESLKDEKIAVVYGTNLGMLMESVFLRNSDIGAHELAQKAAETGKDAVGIFRKAEDEDDDF